MTDVTIVGAGVMGSAVIRACRTAGLEVTAWNRTPAPMPDGATLRTDLREAVSASPVVVLALLNYAVTREVLEPVRPQLRDRVIVQTASGVPAHVPPLADWVQEAGGRYLEAAVLNYPQAVGTDDCFTVFGGPERHYQEIAPLVAALGGTAKFLGTDLAYVKAYHTVSAAYYYSIVNGMLECAAIAAACGVPLEAFAESIPMYDPGLRSTFEVGVELMRRGVYDYEQAPLTTHIDILRNLAALTGQARIDRSFFPALRDRVQRALDEGGRREHIAVVYEQFRERSREAV